MTRTRITALLAFVALFAAAVVALAAVGAPARAASNPPVATIRDKLRVAAVANDIPPKILYAIAYQESTWRQFDANGDPLIGYDGLGIGIMQVTSYDAYGFDVARLKTDIDYNIACGVQVLLEKRSWTPVIGDGDPRCYETWFYAVWAYNGWTKDNQYPYLIWGHIAAGPQGSWAGQEVTPVPKANLVKGLGVAVPTPQPAHYWSATPLPKPVLGVLQAPKRKAAGVRFTVWGTLAPQHAAGAHSVELRLYRPSGAKWVLRRTVQATNQDAAGATKWTAGLSLAKAGSWKLVACALPDAEHAAATSRPAFVTVR